MDYYNEEYVRSQCKLDVEKEIPQGIVNACDSFERLIMRTRSNQRVFLEQFVGVVHELDSAMAKLLEKSGETRKEEEPSEVAPKTAVELWESGDLKHGDLVFSLYKLKEREGRFIGPKPDGKHCVVEIDGEERNISTDNIRVPVVVPA